MSDIRKAIEALRDYEQADEDGVMVLASRQAIHEVIDALNDTLHARALAEAECDRLRAALGLIADAAEGYHAEWTENGMPIPQAFSFAERTGKMARRALGKDT